MKNFKIINISKEKIYNNIYNLERLCIYLNKTLIEMQSMFE